MGDGVGITAGLGQEEPHVVAPRGLIWKELARLEARREAFRGLAQALQGSGEPVPGVDVPRVAFHRLAGELEGARVLPAPARFVTLPLKTNGQAQMRDRVVGQELDGPLRRRDRIL